MELDEAFGAVGEFGRSQQRLAAFLVLLQVGTASAAVPLPGPGKAPGPSEAAAAPGPIKRDGRRAPPGLWLSSCPWWAPVPSPLVLKRGLLPARPLLAAPLNGEGSGGPYP